MRRGPTEKISVLNVDICVSAQRGHYVRKRCSLLSYLLALSQMSQSCTLIGFCRDTMRHASTRRDRIHSTFVAEIAQGGYDDTMIDQEISKVGGCLIIDAKGVFDARHRSESAALSMQHKRSAVEGLALRESI